MLPQAACLCEEAMRGAESLSMGGTLVRVSAFRVRREHKKAGGTLGTEVRIGSAREYETERERDGGCGMWDVGLWDVG